MIHLELLRKKSTPRWTAARVPYREYVEKRLSALSNQERISRKEHEEFARKMERFRQIRDTAYCKMVNFSFNQVFFYSELTADTG